MRRLAVTLIALLFLLPCRALAAESYALRTGGSAVLADADGHLLVGAGVYSDMIRLSDDDLFAARAVGSAQYGLISGDGLALTEFVYDKLSFDGETVIFAQNGMYGAMDTQGTVKIEPRYTRLIPMGEGMFLALKSDPLDDSPDALYTVAEDGGEHSAGIRLSYGPFPAGQGLSVAVAQSGLYGYLGADGQWVVEPQFVWADTMHLGRARVSTEAGMGLIGLDGAWLIEPRAGRLIVSDKMEDAPALCIDEDGISLLSTADGAQIARFEDAWNAAFTGSLICIEDESGVFLIDYAGNIVLSGGAGAEKLNELGGYYIERLDASEDQRFVLLDSDGAEIGRWQELTFAGRYNDVVYAAFSTYDTQTAEIDGLTFRDEVSGSRRYGLIDMTGRVVIDGLTSLKATGRALLTAETDDWLGLIRPDGTIVIRLDKEE